MGLPGLGCVDIAVSARLVISFYLEFGIEVLLMSTLEQVRSVHPLASKHRQSTHTCSHCLTHVCGHCLTHARDLVWHVKLCRSGMQSHSHLHPFALDQCPEACRAFVGMWTAKQNCGTRRHADGHAQSQHLYACRFPGTIAAPVCMPGYSFERPAAQAAHGEYFISFMNSNASSKVCSLPNP